MRSKSNILVKSVLGIGIIAIVSSLVIMLTMTPTPKIKASKEKNVGIINKNSDMGGDFVLTDSNGNDFNSKSLRGKLLLIYFGFTYCPDICPSSLFEMTRAMEEVRKYGDFVQPIFITIDPVRDTAKQLKGYFDGFDKSILALTGNEKEIDKVAKSFRVYYSKAIDGKENTSNYLINHSSFYYLVGKNGKLIKYYAPGSDGKDIGLDVIKYFNS
ncbi:MAG: SCO family protein [Alphaproteobacteria bacterium]|nr:SCO family protein [Alphaproteobacteria bacterium]